ncbi:MAG: putative DNA-binding protein in cluster with Type I restriction-modification system [Candidatus Jettenia ecosi]|uniref:Putative DNA-binding protein in cluster with Type I restriction-modification system n=1 Tax=Candidatus Jettenia ecosi TaxID=2494326 RepID=A0A533QJE5_9BACT|nr:MAG: putative DNA-binding protein in cluster with Type I restriction-modification system [Candidatus Jettenia ecosi]
MTKELFIITKKEIENRIYIIRGVQVMLDRDLAKLYQTETRTLKQTVKRNLDRFPDDFMFELTDNDMDDMVSQSVIPSKSYFGGAKPFAFTEHGVAMLSSVIRTPVAIEISLRIIRAFVEMRKMILSNAALFQRIDRLELKQTEVDRKFEQIFRALESKSKEPEKGIFFDGQVFDAYVFVSGLIKQAEKTLVLIDNYVDESVLMLLAKRAKGIKATLYTKQISQQLEADLKKHNAQYPAIEVKILTNSHDRFLMIDDKELYHIGASLKDLGKKWFAFSKMNSLTNEVMNKLK